MDVAAQVTEKIRKLPQEAQIALLTLAKDWEQKYNPSHDQNHEEQYDQQLLALLDHRSQEAKKHPERMVDAESFIQDRIKRYQ